MAKFFNGSSTIPLIVDIHFHGECLTFEGHSFLVSELEVSHLSPTEMNLMKDNFTIEISASDPDFPRIYQKVLGRRNKGQKRGLLLAGSVMVVAVFAFYVFPIIAHNIPDKYYGYIINEKLLINIFPDTCKVSGELNQEIFAGTGYEGFEVYVNKMPMMNAFAYPFNQIHLTAELVTSLRHDGELMAVVGHELGHLKLQHYKSNIARMLFMDILGSAINQGKVSGVLKSMLLNSYSRDDERDSDKVALEVLGRRRIHPEAGATLMELFQKKVPGQKLAFFSSHPATAERITFFRSATPRIDAKRSSDKKLLSKLISECKL